jgi:hypothetical protein
MSVELRSPICALRAEVKDTFDLGYLGYAGQLGLEGFFGCTRERVSRLNFVIMKLQTGVSRPFFTIVSRPFFAIMGISYLQTYEIM